MPNDKFLNANDTVDLIKTGIGALDEKVNEINNDKSYYFINGTDLQYTFEFKIKLNDSSKTVELKFNGSRSSETLYINWGEGDGQETITKTVTPYTTFTISHTYKNSGNYVIGFSSENGITLGGYNGGVCISPKNILQEIAMNSQANAYRLNVSKNCFAGTSVKRILLYEIALTSYFATSESCFSGCKQLEEIVIQRHNTMYDNYFGIAKNMFSGCCNLQYIPLNLKVNSLSEGCFSGCDFANNFINLNFTNYSGENYPYDCGFASSDANLFVYMNDDIFLPKTSSINLSGKFFAKLYGDYNIYMPAYNKITKNGLTSGPNNSLYNAKLGYGNNKIYVPLSDLNNYKTDSFFSYYANIIEPYSSEAINNKLDKSGGALTGDVTTTNTTFTSTSLVNKDYVDNNTLQEAITDTNSLPTGSNIKDMVYRLATTPITTNTLTIVGTQTDDVASCVALGMTSAAGGSGTIVCTPASPTTIELNSVDTPFVKLVFGENGNAFVYTTAQDFESINTGTYTLKTAGTTTYSYYMGDSTNETTTEIPTMAYINSLNANSTAY